MTHDADAPIGGGRVTSITGNGQLELPESLVTYRMRWPAPFYPVTPPPAQEKPAPTPK